jgi:preprotein translocase subunit SecD
LGSSDISLQGLRVKIQESLGTWWIDVDMNKAQNLAFSRMATRDFHKVTAMVVEGVALNEATIETPSFAGYFAISGPFSSKQAAESVARELDPA